MSRHLSGRIDLFLVIAIAILIISPLVINLSLKLIPDVKRVNLFLSPRFEELFGREMTEALLLEFKERNPDLVIHLQSIQGSPDGAPAPDILIFDEGEFSALAAAGLLANLGLYADYKTDGEEEPVRPTAADTRIAVPLVTFMDLLFYNIDILSDAGFDRPPKTREEFIACAAAVSGENAAGAALSLSPEDRQALSRDVFSWIWAAGRNFRPAEDPSQSPAVNNRAIIGDINFLGSLNRDHLLAPRIFETTGDQRLEEFAEGKAAMIIASTSAIPYLREKMGDSAFGITTIPVSSAAGKYSICLSGIYAGINANSEHPAEAWSFLSFLAEKSPLFCAKFMAVPGMVSDLIPGDYVKDDPFYTKAWDIFESSGIVQGFLGKPGAEEYEGAFLEELKIFFETGRTAQETAAAIQRRWDSVTAP